MDFYPTEGRILAKQFEAEATTASGFYVPDDAKERSHMAEVVSVGTGCTVKPGETIIFSEFKPEKLKLDGQEYMLLRDEDVLMVRGRKKAGG